ncbi:hypothetical protein [Amnibacterium kyonggiense]|uniref:Uncharacterized protein n=1 Tax=Amnibacterium kyonggiense TaxID=595671 RepID=A0A4R7FT80_9MICO|nr:hypothetical protein [Amnibacterium kyonggiense]TDS81083.1 hypothetical protein CLV52_1657 [Amnibacterium kyonggiense]
MSQGNRAVAAASLVLILAGCTAAPGETSVTTLPTDSGPAPALRQVGSRAEVARVHSAATRALTAALHVFDSDEHGNPLTSKAERTRLIDTTSTGTQRARLEHALSELGRPPFRRGGAFVVEHWDGVQITGDRARAYVTGHSSYTPTAAFPQERDGTWQYQLLLVRRGAEWLVIDERAASNEQG